jgi:hypothetical protein
MGSDPLTRRDALKVLGAAGAGAMLSRDAAAQHANTSAAPGGATRELPILPLTSTSDVFVPPRGRAYDKFSFDFPEPSVAVGALRFAFLVFTYENAYAMDPRGMHAVEDADGVTLTCHGFTWAGGQERADGTLTARFRRDGESIEWDTTVEMPQPVKAVTAVIRGVPRGRISGAGGGFVDHHDDEVLLGYPFSGGDLFGPGESGSMSTPFAVIQRDDQSCFCLSSRDDRVRTKRLYFQPGEQAYRVEAAFESEGWLQQRHLVVPTWRVGSAANLEAAATPHVDHVRRAYNIPDWNTRPDVPAWMRDVALVVTLHGMHYTGYIFNDYARMREILRWVASQMPGERVLAFISAWDGRYYWNYPAYRADPRLGGDAGFRALVQDAKRLGVRVMPMFGCNAANRRQPSFARVANAATSKIDGDRFDITWVDWDNDRHQEGWLSYMNLGVDSWRDWLRDRISDTISRYDVDAYFLDIAGGWVNNNRADMHAGMRQLVSELRAAHPHVLACGEMCYDALLEFIPLFQVQAQWGVGAEMQHLVRSFQHLSHPAPGRGSSGVHESGFGDWDPKTLSLRESQIPTLSVVDDTFDKHRDEMAAVIRQAMVMADRARAGKE